jgi:hypothetical protein
MTVNEYLNDVFLYNGNDGNLEFYKLAVQGKGEVIAEYDKGDQSVSLLHTDRSGRYFNYQVTDVKELKETVEYCLGPIVTDNQWRKATTNDLVIDDGEDWDVIDD